MPWERKYSNFGNARIDGKNVKVFCDANDYITIGLGEDVTNAVWTGEELDITLKSGKVRRYRDRNYYSTV